MPCAVSSEAVWEQGVLTYHVRLVDNKESPNVSLPPVPVDYLEPVHPTAPGQKAVVMSHGPYRRLRVTTNVRDGTDWRCELDSGEFKVFENKVLCVVDPSFKA